MASSRHSHLFLLLLFSLLQAKTHFGALILSRKNHQNSEDHRRRPWMQANQSSCNIFSGSWIKDATFPLYKSSSCPAIDPLFNCKLFGRPDSDYESFRWQPLSCNLPRFEGRDFLERMREKKVIFVGDSMGRNQWESLVCLLWGNGEAEFTRGDPLSRATFTEYGVAVEYYRAPYLVEVAAVEGKRVLRLDEVAGGGEEWRSADVVSFHTGHWWTHTGGLQGWDYIEFGGSYYTDMNRLAAMKRALTTWANWVDSTVDRSKTKVFFQSISPIHYDPSEWSDPVSKNCYGETTPVSGWADFRGTYPDQMKVVDDVVGTMRAPPYLLDITALSVLRKDAHSSVYNGDLNPVQRANPDQYADCSHWCLPGLPDTWNLLFYAALFF